MNWTEKFTKLKHLENVLIHLILSSNFLVDLTLFFVKNIVEWKWYSITHEKKWYWLLKKFWTKFMLYILTKSLTFKVWLTSIIRKGILYSRNSMQIFVHFLYCVSTNWVWFKLSSCNKSITVEFILMTSSWMMRLSLSMIYFQLLHLCCLH